MPATNVNVPSCLKLQRFETIFQIPALSQSNYKRQWHRSDFAPPFFNCRHAYQIWVFSLGSINLLLFAVDLPFPAHFD